MIETTPFERGLLEILAHAYMMADPARTPVLAGYLRDGMQWAVAMQKHLAGGGDVSLDAVKAQRQAARRAARMRGDANGSDREAATA